MGAALHPPHGQGQYHDRAESGEPEGDQGTPSLQKARRVPSVSQIACSALSGHFRHVCVINPEILTILSIFCLPY